jgi:GDP-L-fucose synthase
MLDAGTRVLLLGHRGLVGSAFARALSDGDRADLRVVGSAECDLRDSRAVESLLADARPNLVILAAAHVGGINANRMHPAEFIYDNIAIETNVIHGCWLSGVDRLVFLGSSCVYPRECPQPMREEYLLTGPLEPTNEGYAIAKIAGVKMAQMYNQQYGLGVLCPMPCNLYGPGDSFDLERSHVLSALVRRFSDAVRDATDSVTLWGTGSARREFMHVDDMVRACLMLLDAWPGPEIINVGVGTDVSIQELAAMIVSATGFAGEIRWDSSMPDGMPRKCLDVSRLSALGFVPEIDLERGVREMVESYRSQPAEQGSQEASR